MAEIPHFIEAGAFGLLNDVLSGFHSNNGYAQPNRFEILILPPSKRALPPNSGGTNNIFSGAERKSDIRSISMRCDSISLPGRNLSTMTDANIYGPTREIVEGVTFAEDINIVFNGSSGLDERVFFENWQRQAFNEETWDVEYYNDYVGEVEIYLLDKQEQRRYGLKLHEAFPKTVAANELGMGMSGEIIKTTVGFTFRFWTALNKNQQAPNLGDRMINTVMNVAERNLTRNIPRLRLLL